jgi:hypothetical protein
LLNTAGPLLQLIAHTRSVLEAEEWLRLVPGLEGVVAKRADSRYLPGQREWVKVKKVPTADCVVIGVAGDWAQPAPCSGCATRIVSSTTWDTLGCHLSCWAGAEREAESVPALFPALRSSQSLSQGSSAVAAQARWSGQWWASAPRDRPAHPLDGHAEPLNTQVCA